jgi:hypothetical protein
VGFSRILGELQAWYKPLWTLAAGGRELVSFYRQSGFTEEDYRGRKTNRLLQLHHLLAERLIDGDLHWNRP